MNTKDFKHKITIKVRFNEVDMLGVCNNAVYMSYLEHARLGYVKAAGLIPEGGLFSDGKLFFVVRNEINYRSHAFYDDELYVYSRISFIKNSSFGFEQKIVKKKTKQIIADAKSVVVCVDSKTRKSTSLPEYFIDRVRTIDNKVQIIRE